MKKYIWTAGICLGMTCPAFAMVSLSPAPESQKSQSYVYIGSGLVQAESSSGSLFGLSAQMDYDAGLLLAVAAGVDRGATRFEVELSDRFLTTDTLKVEGFAPYQTDASVTTLSLSVNGYYDMDTGTAVTPYVMGGVGLTYVTVGAEPGLWASDSDVVFGMQLGLGVQFTVSEHVALDAGYRYMFNQDASFELAEVSFNAHHLTVGVRINY